MKNCPNCGAPIEPYKCKCEHCGTWYFDFTAFDMSKDEPYYIKFRTPRGTLTALARPELNTIETSADTTDITVDGHVLQTFVTSYNCDLNVTFHTLMSNGCLYMVQSN